MKQKIKSIYKKILKKLRIVTVYDINNQYNTKNDLQLQINELQKQNNEQYTQINNLQIEMFKLGEQLKANVAIIKNDNYKVERELFKTYKGLEYKIYEFNKGANELLYENNLKINEICGKTKEGDFQPKVSIVIPAYNASNYIRQAIDSAINQTYKNIEIIVVNDGSTDNGKTEEICLSYGNKIRYYKKENGGVSSALNLGISVMTGEYFAWLSHDDLYYPSNIYEHIRCLEHNRSGKLITFTNFNIIDENSNIMLPETISSNLFCFDYKINQTKPEYSLLQGEINGGSVVIPKEAFEKCGLFNENLRISQEREMWFRLIQGGYTFYNIPLETTAIRFHSNQVTNTNNTTEKETNKKRLEIIEALDLEVKEKLEHSEYNFYTNMKNFYYLSGIKEMEKEMDNHIKRLKK